MLAVQAVINDCEHECSRVDQDALDSDSENSSQLDSDQYSSDDVTDAAERWRFILKRFRDRQVLRTTSSSCITCIHIYTRIHTYIHSMV